MMENARRFVDAFLRQNSNEDLVAHIAIKEHVVAVSFTGAERAIYLAEVHRLNYVYVSKSKEDNEDDVNAALGGLGGSKNMMDLGVNAALGGLGGGAINN